MKKITSNKTTKRTNNVTAKNTAPPERLVNSRQDSTSRQSSTSRQDSKSHQSSPHAKHRVEFLVHSNSPRVPPHMNLAAAYISHDQSTGEIFYDRFNIDFLRYFGISNVLLTTIGSTIGALVAVYAGVVDGLNVIAINSLYEYIFIGSVSWFFLTAMIAYKANGHFQKAARIAGRRGLFTCIIMFLVGVSTLVSTGHITGDTSVYWFLKSMMGTIIMQSCFAVPLDYGVAFLNGLSKKSAPLKKIEKKSATMQRKILSRASLRQ